MTEAVIVRAGVDRLDELEPLWEALRQHHHAVMPSLGPLRDRADSWQRRRAHYERVLAEPASFLLVAERRDGTEPGDAAEPGDGGELGAGPQHGGGLVGYALLATGSPSQTWAIESPATLETIVLLPEARGRGLGTRLVERVKEEVRAAGISHLGLGVVAGNEDAIRFYRRHGFEPAFVEMITRP